MLCMNMGSITGRGDFFSFPVSRLLSNDYQALYTLGYSHHGILLTIQLHPVLKVTTEWNFTSTPPDVIPDFVCTTNFTFFIFKNFVSK